MLESLAIYAVDAGCRPHAAALAEELGVPLVSGLPQTPGAVLAVTEARLELRLSGAGVFGPVFAEFVRGALGYRLQRGGGKRQALARAVGIRTGERPSVLDGTAGLGRDGFILACLGCNVQMVERNPVVFALLRDGLQRACAVPALREVVTDRISIHRADCTAALTASAEAACPPDVVYLDPMFPARTKSAQVKKEMQALRVLVGDDADANALLGLALGVAGDRVVVKRHRRAPPLRGPAPDMTVEGKRGRFDVYLTHDRRGPNNP